MKLIFVLLLILTFILGCGGSKSDATNDSKDNNFTILRGTVPGTLIEVFCVDGSYYKTNSVKNETSKHPFELSIPKNKNCQLVMTTNEESDNEQVIMHIAFIQNDKKSLLFTPLKDEINLGYIDLKLTREETLDINNDGVLEDFYELNIEESLELIYLDSNPLDNDGDGILNVYEDYDSDSISNYYDEDDDNDGINDCEDYDDNGDGIDDEDFDGDGIIDSLDYDFNNNGFYDEHFDGECS